MQAVPHAGFVSTTMGPTADPTQTSSDDTPGCCDPGGCCNPAPPRQQLNADGSVSILRVPYVIQQCCSHSQPWGAKDLLVPSQLGQAGVSESEWAQWSQQLYTQVNMIKDPPCPGCAICIVCSIGTLGLAVPFMCAAGKTSVLKWDAAFRQWQADFNAQVLQPKGIFCKSQSLCWVTRGPKGEKQRHYHRWIAFAFGPDACMSLQNQPHLQGDIEDHTCCNGFNEHVLCMHP